MDISFELWVARYYTNKVQNAKRDGYEFSLSLQSVHNMLAAKRCYYTGVELTRPNIDSSGVVIPGKKSRSTNVTIDRIDNSKGYVKGNVVACSLAANRFKSKVENPCYDVNIDDMIKMSNKLKSRKG